MGVAKLIFLKPNVEPVHHENVPLQPCAAYDSVEMQPTQRITVQVLYDLLIFGICSGFHVTAFFPPFLRVVSPTDASRHALRVFKRIYPSSRFVIDFEGFVALRGIFLLWQQLFVPATTQSGAAGPRVLAQAQGSAA
eukprot:2048646-Pleurochrysis_carterae.AAC.1